MTESVEQEIRTLRSLFWSERDPDGHGFAPLADAYRRAGDSKQALEVLDDGIGRHPEFVPGHVVAARLYMDLEFFEEAALAAQNALGLDMENVEALRVLAGALDGKGESVTAMEVRERLAVLEPPKAAVAEEADTGTPAPDDLADVAEPATDVAAEERLDAAAFGEADHGARETQEYVAAGEGMEEVDHGLDMSLDAPPEDEEPEAVEDPVFDVAAIGLEEPAAVVEDVAAEDEVAADEEPVMELGALAPDEPEVDDEPVLELGSLAPDEADDADEPEADEDPVMELAALAPDEPEVDEEPVMELAALAPDEPEVDGEPVMELAALAPDEPDSAGVISDILSEEAADAPLEEIDEPPIYTRTIAELYVTQGAVDRAVDVYRHLVEAEPGNTDLTQRLALLEAQLAGEAAPDAEAEERAVPDMSDEETVESLARHLAESGDATHDVDTPFAWTEGETADAPSDAPPIGEYFTRMLEWKPDDGEEARAEGDQL